ncbi:MAG: acyltransferase [Muribaculum sp.]|nr:acyltransferase [Muribaculum sp.]
MKLIKKIRYILKSVVYRIRGEYTTEKLIKNGLKVGSNFTRMKGVILDPGHIWHIQIGDNVTLAPNVHILAHDSSFKLFLGMTRVGNVVIGNNVFIGAESVILPNVKIGNNCVIGANSTVSSDIPDNVVAAGSPAKIICSYDDFISKARTQLKIFDSFDSSFTIRNGISDDQKAQMYESVKRNGYCFVE